jgi:hypothetical protein
VAFSIGRAVAPSHRLQVGLALSGLLSVGVVLQAMEAMNQLRSTTPATRGTGVVSLWEAAGFALATALFLSIPHRRRPAS